VSASVNSWKLSCNRPMRLLGMSKMTVNYLFTKATTDHKTPAQIIDELVQEKVTAVAV
jgi:hypothetical protein